MTNDGELLSDRLQRGRIPLDEAIVIARQVAATLADAHAVSMIYRNLEPASIVLHERARLRDFDLASVVRPASPTSQPYLAPECTAGVEADRRGDVYALGCILSEMLCTHAPNSGMWLLLPAQLDAMLVAMQATEPHARPTMVEVVQQLAALPTDLANDPTVKLRAEVEPHIEAGQWKTAIETIDRRIADDYDSLLRGVCFYAIATICRDELGARDDALERYDSALDEFFSKPDVLAGPMLPYAMRGFHAIEQLLSEPSEWRALDRAHRKMIVRVKHQATQEFVRLQAHLFDRLAEIYRAHESVESAISALECAHELDPDNRARAMTLAELRHQG